MNGSKMRVMAVAAVLMFSGVLAGRAEGGKDRLVVRGDYDAPSEWAPKKVLGRDYWAAFYNNQKAPQKGKEDPVWQLPMFSECMTEYIGWQYAPLPIDHGFKIRRDIDPKRYGDKTPPYCDWVRPDHKVDTAYALEDFFPGKDVPMFNSLPTDDTPFLINLMGISTKAGFVGREYNQDRAKYQAWKTKHPGFLGFKTPNEYDTWLHNHVWSYDKIEIPSIREYFEDNGLQPPHTSRGMVEFSREIMRRQAEAHFGETNLWPMVTANFTFLPMLASFGVPGLLYEATPQGRGLWQVAGAFLRGAGRQFGIPYGWYMAHFWNPYTRPDKDGKQICSSGNNCFVSEKNPIRSKENGPEWGVSVSLCDRQAAYGWMIGSAFLFRENAQRINTAEDADGRNVPSVVAKKFARYGEMSAREERGSAYTPVAILTSVSEFFSNCGPANYKHVDYLDNYSQCAFFTTLAPPCSEDAHYDIPRRRGQEGCLFNSPYGEMYDVIIPDAGQDEKAFLKVLSAYKCAFLVGGFEKKHLATGAIRDYVLGGGTLFISADRIADGLVDGAFAGVSFANGATARSGASMTDERGRTVELKSAYAWHVADPGATAKPFLRDSNGAVVAYAQDRGKGRVVTVTASKMMPAKYEPNLGQTWPRISEFFSGKQPVEVIAYFLGRVRDETMPVRVEGDVQWGVNRLTSGGWRLWVLNNKGITHYAREAAEIDHAADAHVEVTFRDSGRKLSFDLPAGEWRTEVVK